jgi:hypothetical protein
MAPQRIDLASARSDKSLAWRLCKITTASTEEAAPYQSIGDVYRGQYLDAETSREKDLAGVPVWTAHETRIGEWLLAVQTPFGHWEGVAFYEWVKIDQKGYMYAFGTSGVKATIPLAYATAYNALEVDSFQDLPESFGYVKTLDNIRSSGGGYVADLERGVLRYDCGDYVGRRLMRVRFPYCRIDHLTDRLVGLNYRLGIYTSDTIPTTIGAWMTTNGEVTITEEPGAYTLTDGQIKGDIELQDYLFVSVIIDEATSPTTTGRVRLMASTLTDMRISLGLEPEI